MLEDKTITSSLSDFMPELIPELEILSGRSDPRLPSGLFRTATNLDQLVALADTLRLESCDPNCSWENPTLERFEEALVAWLDDVRFGPLVKRNLGRTLPIHVGLRFEPPFRVLKTLSLDPSQSSLKLSTSQTSLASARTSFGSFQIR